MVELAEDKEKHSKPHRNPNKLSRRYAQVVDNYYGPANMSKTDAMRMAGYSFADRHQSRIFNHPAVVAEMERREAEVRRRYDLSYERVMAELMKIAYSNPLDYWDVREDGSVKLNLAKANAHEMAAIGKIKVKTRELHDNEGNVIGTETTAEAEAWNKVAALEALIRHGGLSREKKDGVDDLVDRLRAGRGRVKLEIEVDDDAVDVTPESSEEDLSSEASAKEKRHG